MEIELHLNSRGDSSQSPIANHQSRNSLPFKGDELSAIAFHEAELKAALLQLDEC